jgi:hypothetical protein
MIDGHDRDGTARYHNAFAVGSSRSDLQFHGATAISSLLPSHKIGEKFCQKLNELIYGLARDQKAVASICACTTPQTPEVF